MMLPYEELFSWWAATITTGIMFLIVVSSAIYYYRKRPASTKTDAPKVIREFAFVWALMALLILYLVSINLGSYLLFAAGNIVVEALLLIYVYIKR
jgi:O-antigen/teichoic acid export membrane protein